MKLVQQEEEDQDKYDTNTLHSVTAPCRYLEKERQLAKARLREKEVAREEREAAKDRARWGFRIVFLIVNCSQHDHHL